MSSRLLLLLVPLLLFYQLNITGCIQQNADQDEDEDEDDDTEEDKQSFDDDRVYKNPRNFPSPECPRDEARATFMCDPGFVTKGFQSARCHAKDSQNTATWFGPDISCDPKSCGDPPTIAHGSHEGSCYTVGCKVNYTCEVGFQITGKSEHTCLVDGNWYPKELPVCLRKYLSLREFAEEHSLEA
ncbi:sushi, von Willebrand factor type A, EGF and pentraxin domain-containing protein 1-like [Diaphorina citri]|uniref:Sushi, von Willebrand factor type A, EGF and pentraxin domain-containing protein 1-like n=1 Tax=Diaphorina citri TaxID=121845 RepID=A0A3Q0J7R0_DIACI|nr:sushi, von Willebrand factor type A, EGF and pentraxin domain-containing protein 1-like [Diaphorina citri]